MKNDENPKAGYPSGLDDIPTVPRPKENPEVTWIDEGDAGYNPGHGRVMQQVYTNPPFWKAPRLIFGITLAVIGLIIIGFTLWSVSKTSKGLAPATDITASPKEAAADTPAAKPVKKKAAVKKTIVKPELSLEVVHGDLVKLHGWLVKDFQPFVQKTHDRTDALEAELASAKRRLSRHERTFTNIKNILIIFLAIFFIAFFLLHRFKKLDAKIEEVRHP